MSNLTKSKREKMLDYLYKLREIHNDDENIVAINQIELALTNLKYGLVWDKHEENVDIMMVKHIPVFSEIKKYKITTDKDLGYNFLLEGDNLHSLKLLEKTHLGRIDVIYIDPPYNTGNKDFIYDDDYVGLDDGYRHSKWLSFMCSRLNIAKNLLSEKGIIFISIDDNEQSQLKLLCDSIFGEQNFLTMFIRKTKSMTGDDGNGLNIQHEYLLVYARYKERAVFTGEIKTFDNYSNPDNDPNGIWVSADPSAKSGSESTYFPIENPITGQTDLPPKGRYWAFSQETLEKYIDSGRIKFKDKIFKGQRGFVFKRYAETMEKTTHSVGTLIFDDNKYMNSVATTETNKLIGAGKFNYPKPVEFIKKLIEYTSDKNSIILDFFAGSGTTAEAVMKLNSEDGGNRKFILCTNNENNICEKITYDRIKKVILGHDRIVRTKEILSEYKLLISNLRKMPQIFEEINSIKDAKQSEYDKFVIESKEGFLRIYGEKNIDEKVFGTPHNLKYFKTDYIPKISKSEDILSNRLLNYIVEMVELENMCEIDNVNNVIVLNESELSKKLETINNEASLYIPSYILLSKEEENKVLNKKIKIINIPDYYFMDELIEANEI